MSTLRPYLPIAPNIAWTKAMRRVQDECDEHKRVYYASKVFFDCAAVVQHATDNQGGHAQYLKAALREALVADIYIRYISGRNGNGCQILVRRHTTDGCAIYYRRLSSAGGFDLVAHLLHGVPLWLPKDYDYAAPETHAEKYAARPPCILTDHCGLDGVAKPSAFGRDWRSLTLDSPELEQLGYVVL